MPDDQTTSFSIQPDGNRVVIPLRGHETYTSVLIEVRGEFRCAYNNHAYDAAYQCDESGAGDPSRPHPYLRWEPYVPFLELADASAHRYLFRLRTPQPGVSPTVRIDVDHFIDDFLIPPSEVRNSLTGRFDLAVRSAPVPAPADWPIGLAAIPGLAVIGAVAWILQRRMSTTLLDYDLRAQLDRVRQKSEAARRAVRREDGRLVPVAARLETLQVGARSLAIQTQKVRNARALHNRGGIERDVAEMERRIVASGTATEDLAQTLQARHRALRGLTDLERTEAQLTSRLARIEAALDSALTGLQTVSIRATAPAVRDTVCMALEAEVEALREAGAPVTERADAVLGGTGGR